MSYSIRGRLVLANAPSLPFLALIVVALTFVRASCTKVAGRRAAHAPTSAAVARPANQDEGGFRSPFKDEVRTVAAARLGHE